jgi:hypothetical protein
MSINGEDAFDPARQGQGTAAIRTTGGNQHDQVVCTFRRGTLTSALNRLDKPAPQRSRFASVSAIALRLN